LSSDAFKNALAELISKTMENPIEEVFVLKWKIIDLFSFSEDNIKFNSSIHFQCSDYKAIDCS
jgi:hypothetical protein